MAIDTKDKRSSAIGVGLAFIVLLPDPDNSISAADRQHAAAFYRGIAAELAAISPARLPACIDAEAAEAEEIPWREYVHVNPNSPYRAIRGLMCGINERSHEVDILTRAVEDLTYMVRTMAYAARPNPILQENGREVLTEDGEPLLLEPANLMMRAEQLSAHILCEDGTTPLLQENGRYLLLEKRTGEAVATMAARFRPIYEPEQQLPLYPAPRGR